MNFLKVLSQNNPYKILDSLKSKISKNRVSKFENFKVLLQIWKEEIWRGSRAWSSNKQ